MKKLCAFCFILLLSIQALAADNDHLKNDHLKYVGGTELNVKPGVAGRPDMTGETAPPFQHAGRKLSIPYSSIESSEYSQEVARP